LLHNKSKNLGGVDLHYNFSSMQINGLGLSEKMMKMHLEHER
jgi:hypothetical protein